MPTPDFSKIFGTNATSTQNWSDNNYLTGWGFLGQAPPPYQLFDDYFKNTDTKLKWLYDNFGSIDVTTAINTHNSDIESHPKLNFNILKRNKAYSIGDIAYSSTIPSWAQLQCKTAGTTGASEPILGTVTAGQELTDGTVKWRVSNVRNFFSIELSSVNLNTVYDSGFYWVNSSCTNQPVAGGNFHLLVQGGTYSGTTPQNFTQIATKHDTGVTYTRTCTGGTWGDWKKLIAGSDFTQSLTSNGWTKLPNGLIMQWVKSTSNKTITFPIAFPNSVLCVTHAFEGLTTSTINAQYYAIRTLTNTGFTLYSAITDADSTGKYHWLAIGY